MTNEEFLQQFGHFVEAPNGIQKLRELVLSLAVQGKLVEQDPQEEPASSLLKQVELSREDYLNLNKAKRKNYSPIDISDCDLGCPSGWELIRLGMLGEFCGGGTPSKNKAEYWDGDIPWVSPKDMKFDSIASSELMITEKAVSETTVRLIPPGSLLIVARSGILKRTLPVSINSVQCTVNQDIKVIVPFYPPITPYIRLMLKGFESFILRELVKGGVTVQSLKYTEFEQHPFPLPPLAEQHRIVAKVDELMALCDQLEAERNTRAATHQRLIRAVHHPLTEAADPRAHAADPLATWRRIRTHFADLYTTPESVQALRQTILQLAVQGRLVPQDSKDKSAKALLEQVIASKKQLIESGELKRTKVHLPLESSEIPFFLPHSWVALRFEDLFNFIDYRGKTPKKTSEGIRLITAKNIRMGFLQEEPKEYVAETTYEKWMTRGFPKMGDLLFTTEAPMGNVCVVDIRERFALAQRAINLQPYVAVVSKFFMYAIMSAQIQDLISGKSSGMTATGIKSAKLKLLPLPLPPLAEQHRIVAKVNELMTLCDQLEANIRDRDATASSYAEAIVQQIAAA
jgi:type I restriction enzyme S subunit